MLDALVAEARLRWGLDPANGLQVVAAESLVATPIEPSRPVLVVPLAMLRAETGGHDPVPLPGRAGPAGRDPLTLLRRLYPAEHPVGRFGAADGATIGSLDAPRPSPRRSTSPRSPPSWRSPVRGRCPGSRPGCASPTAARGTASRPTPRSASTSSRRPTRSTTRSRRAPRPSWPASSATCGSRSSCTRSSPAEAGVFDLADVQAAIASKIVRRHPHVFGDAVARTASDVNRQWERIKADERAAAAGPAKSALDGISPSMPALAASQEMQERAANLGYDWPSIDGVLDKVAEEADELRQAASDAERAEEFGDLLFVLVNVARRRGIEAEAAVRAANAKFRRRFASVERGAAAQGVALRDLDFAALDALWDAAKAEERTT